MVFSVEEQTAQSSLGERATRVAGALIRRVAIMFVIMLVMSFVVAWLLETAPIVAYLLGALSLALLARTLWKALRSERPAVALGMIAGSFLIGILLAFAIDAAFGTDPDAVEASEEVG